MTTNEYAANMLMKGKRMTADQFTERVEAVKHQLYRTALLYLGNEADALEAVDECVYKALKGYRKLKSGHFNTWITRILINTCNDELRHRMRVQPTNALPEQPTEDYDALPLKQAISKLPDELRVVVSLRFFAGLTQRQTAEALGIPRGTVSTRQIKAFKLLKLELDEGE